MFTFVFLFFFSTSLCLADNIDGVALSHAEQAAYIQTGASAFTTSIQKYYERKARDITTEAGLMPVVAPILVTYKIYRTKNVSFPIAHNTKLTLAVSNIVEPSTRAYSFGIEWKW